MTVTADWIMKASKEELQENANAIQNYINFKSNQIKKSKQRLAEQEIILNDVLNYLKLKGFKYV